MKSIHILKNPILNYAWGSHIAIAELTGRPFPTREPEAEMWMGAHPKAPSTFKTAHGDESLLELINRHPQDILGNKTATAHKNRLPYLFKVLAIEKPLSIQAHPNRAQARHGFAIENRLKVPMDAAERNYRDDNHKPECICALTPFWALNGFRNITDMVLLLKKACSLSLEENIRELENRQDAKGLKCFIQTLLDMDAASVDTVLHEAISHAEQLKSRDPVFDWVIRLHSSYPGDVGVMFPLILNLVCLNPGQAMYLPAGQMHAYLKGVGIELMANSDNVLRGGLTPKHVDAGELLGILNFDAQPLEIIEPIKRRASEKAYPTPAIEFELSIIEAVEREPYTSGKDRCAEILLLTSGEIEIFQTSESKTVKLTRGMSVIVPAAVESYRIIGEGTVYKAGV